MAISSRPHAPFAEARRLGLLATSRGHRRGQLTMERDDTPPADGAADLDEARGALAGDLRKRDAVLARLQPLPAMLQIKNLRLGSPLRAHELEDAIQNATIAVWQKLDRFDGRVPLLHWAYGFAVVELRRTVERRARRREQAAEAEFAAAAPTPAIDAEAVQRLLAHLAPEEQVIVRQKHFDELTFEAIAARVQAPVNTVKTKYYRALQRLRERLAARHRQEERDDG